MHRSVNITLFSVKFNSSLPKYCLTESQRCLCSVCPNNLPILIPSTTITRMALLLAHNRFEHPKLPYFTFNVMFSIRFRQAGNVEFYKRNQMILVIVLYHFVTGNCTVMSISDEQNLAP